MRIFKGISLPDYRTNPFFNDGTKYTKGCGYGFGISTGKGYGNGYGYGFISGDGYGEYPLDLVQYWS